MSVKKENRPKRKIRIGGFNPMNVGYSANPDIIVKDKNGTSVKGDLPSPPKPPKGGSGESEKITRPSPQ